jgi:toxin ParE1/3/4
VGRRARTALQDRVTLPVIVRAGAAADVAAAVAYYQRVGHADRFLTELDVVVQRVSALPRAAQVVHAEVRRALMRRYPYAVFYIVDPRAIVVLAVLHQHAHPSRWPDDR